MRSLSLLWIRWILLGLIVGVVCGGSSAFFLWALDHATHFRVTHPWMIYALPFAGLGIGGIYERFGHPIKGGTNLAIDAMKDAPQIPTRMAPMVLVGTLLTHLFGGSAGREGTAVQMGASSADWIAHRFRTPANVRTDLVAAGVAGGFGSVFGTPFAGAIFAIEFASIGRWKYSAIIPCLVASFAGDFCTRALGIVHTPYPTLVPTPFSFVLAGKWIAFALVIALTTFSFISLSHLLKHWSEKLLPRLPLRMFVGGMLVVMLASALRTNDYLGLGLPTIERSFVDASIPTGAFALKLVFTAITVGFGFLGGEVTPLFFVGATLGNALATPLGLPVPLAAAVGLASVFAAASNAPFALIVMAIELFGVSCLPHVALVSSIAYFLIGHRSIYLSQQIHRTKWGRALVEPTTMRDFRNFKGR